MGTLGRSIALSLTVLCAAAAPAHAINGAPSTGIRSKVKKVVASAMVGVALVGGTFGIMHAKNDLNHKAQQVEAAAASVESTLQMRTDLLPNLMRTVKAAAANESSVITNVANAQAQMMGATTMQARAAASQRLSMALQPILNMQTQYPSLRSDVHFSELISKLSEVEARIKTERDWYNGAVQAYNSDLVSQPKGWFKGDLKKAEYFKADAASHAGAPVLDFNKQ